MTRSFWRGRRVFLTGHTGFKGGWLALWLSDMGAEVHGYALPPPTTPSLFEISDIGQRLSSSTMADIRDSSALASALRTSKAEVVFHLAAQPLVRQSYRDPIETFGTNVMGTVHLLDAVRSSEGVRCVVNVTTDKCYEHRDGDAPFCETDRMGGHDPYSSSKGCSELITDAYRRSFLAAQGVRVASARAGNVIGGGDWARDRLVPDFLRAIDAECEIVIRSPGATRPWQHVLEPISGYLQLAERLCEGGEPFDGAWNFGPPRTDSRSVRWIVEHLCREVPGARWRVSTDPQPHEAHFLSLDNTKAREQLKWTPRWSIETALARTLAWHRAWRSGDPMQPQCIAQIREYEDSR
ncbi:MAG: CDP-glucose 4,6-dehydratase [Planctomycetes bacterium]|nr:CDP-glucose 4,6-dehydratase [Planctomycetota bacterium]